MTLETTAEGRMGEIRRWSRLAIQLNGALDSGNYEHITIEVILTELRKGTVFDYLMAELPRSVWDISKLTDVDRHKLSQHWRQFAEAYEPRQFHVHRNGLALLVAYVLHLIDGYHTTLPT
jgi:hypothetical protein